MILSNSNSIIFGNYIFASNVYVGANNLWSSYNFKAVSKFYAMSFNGETPKVNGVTLSLLDDGEYMDGTPRYQLIDEVTAKLVSCATSASGILMTRLNYDDYEYRVLVTSIGDFALQNCTGITNVAIRKEIATIGQQAFDGCNSLETVFFEQNSNLTEIKDYCFGSCYSLHTVELPNSITDIGDGAFSDCSDLKRINCYAQTAPNIGNDVFYNVGTSTINVPVGASGYSTTFGGLNVNYSL